MTRLILLLLTLLFSLSGPAMGENSDFGHCAFAGKGGGDDLISFYHGTSKVGAESIGANGINLGAGRARVDFGQGFYTTIVATNRNSHAIAGSMPKSEEAS